MNADRYTKTVLTVIAIALCLNVAVQLMPIAHAYGTGQDVTVTNYETDVSSGETLYVYCTNC